MTDIAGPAAAQTARVGAFTGWLIARGRRPWPEIHALVDGCTCAWADLDGFHTEPAPASPPLATHLWAWNEDRLLRVRIDGSDGIAAELRLTEAGRGEPVTVTVREAVSWPAGEGRVSAGQQWRDRPLRVYQVEDLMPLEFTRLGDFSPQDQDATGQGGPAEAAGQQPVNPPHLRG
jgi:hypothetical protein